MRLLLRAAVAAKAPLMSRVLFQKWFRSRNRDVYELGALESISIVFSRKMYVGGLTQKFDKKRHPKTQVTFALLSLT